MSRTATLATIAAVVALVATAGITWFVLARADTNEPARTMTVNGNITLTTADVYYWSGQLGEECYGTGPFKDMVEGAPVTVYDTNGDILGQGQLRQGAWYDSCLFRFSVHNVREEPTIQVEVAGRGKVAFDLDQVKTGGVKLSIGP